MGFKLERGTYTELYTRQDIANLLRALEPANMRSGFDHGWLEALCRLGIACGIVYNAPVPPPSPRMIDGEVTP